MRFITKWLLLVSVGLMAWENGNATDVDFGAVSGTWGKAESPYYVKGNIWVEEGTTLTIEPGVTVVFVASGLNVNGQLLAQGTENDNIVFASQDGYSAGVISFMSPGKSIMEYTSIQTSPVFIYIYDGTVYCSPFVRPKIAGL